MSHYMTALAMKQKGLKPATKIVLYWIADHYNHDTGACFPSHKRLAELCEMSRQSVINHIQILKELNILEASNRIRENGSNTSCEYKLLIENEDVQNIDTPSTNILHEDVQLFNTNNLVNTNLISEQDNYSDPKDKDYFSMFWDYYPKKVGKTYAKKCFLKAIKNTDAFTIVDKVIQYAKSVEGKSKQFIPNPATWLNQGRWEDELIEEQQTTSTAYLESLLTDFEAGTAMIGSNK